MFILNSIIYSVCHSFIYLTFDGTHRDLEVPKF